MKLGKFDSITITENHLVGLERRWESNGQNEYRKIVIPSLHLDSFPFLCLDGDFDQILLVFRIELGFRTFNCSLGRYLLWTYGVLLLIRCRGLCRLRL